MEALPSSAPAVKPSADWGAEPAAATQRPTDRKVHGKGGGTVPDRRRAGRDTLLAANAAQATLAAQAKLGGAHPAVRALCGVAPRGGGGGEVGGVGAGAEVPLTPTQTDDLESPTHLERLGEVRRSARSPQFSAATATATARVVIWRPDNFEGLARLFFYPRRVPEVQPQPQITRVYICCIKLV